MGLIKRLRRITGARIEAFLDSVETPEAVLPRLVGELAEKVAEAAAAEAKALTAVKAAHRRLDEAAGRGARMEHGAKLAVAAGDIDTARQAIAAQIEAEEQAETCRDQLAAAEGACGDASVVQRQLQMELEDLKAHKDHILARLRDVRRRHSGRAGPTAAAPADGRSLLEEVARMEAKVDAEEAELDIREETSPVLAAARTEQRLDSVRHAAEVDRRLAQLKKELGRN